MLEEPIYGDAEDQVRRDNLGWWGRTAQLQSQVARQGVEAAETDATSSGYARQRMALSQAQRAGAQAGVSRGANLLAQRQGLRTAQASAGEGVAQSAQLRSQEIAAARGQHQNVLGQQVAGHLAYKGLEQNDEQFQKSWEQARENEAWRQRQQQADTIVQAYGVAAQAAGGIAGGMSDERLKEAIDGPLRFEGGDRGPEFESDPFPAPPGPTAPATTQPVTPPATTQPATTQPQPTAPATSEQDRAAREAQQRELEIQSQKVAAGADAKAVAAVDQRVADRANADRAGELQSLTSRALAQNQDPNRGWKALKEGIGGMASGISSAGKAPPGATTAGATGPAAGSPALSSAQSLQAKPQGTQFINYFGSQGGGPQSGFAQSDERTKSVGQLDDQGASTLRSLQPRRWRYTPEAQQELGLTGREQVSPTAQDLEATPWGKLVVYDTQAGKQIDTAGATLQQYALLSSLQHQVDQLKRRNHAA